MIAKVSVKKPYTVLVAVVLVIILGCVSFTRMTTDLLPSINLPYVIVMTTYPGANPETVEMVVTKPVEQSMAMVSNIENISSISGENYSMVILEFAQTANMDSVSLEIRENLDQIKSFWDDSVGNPIIMKLNPDMLPVMVAAVGVEGKTNAEITDMANDVLMPALESLEGVASVDAEGLVEESVHVIIRQEKIDAVNLQVFGYVEGEFEDAEKELEDAGKELADGQKELNDSIADLRENEADLQENKSDLEDGLNEVRSGIKELDSKKTETAAQLAAAQTLIDEQRAEITKNLAAIEAELGDYTKCKELVNAFDSLLEGLEGIKAQAQAAESEAPGSGDGVVAAGISGILESLKGTPMESQAEALLGSVDTITGLEGAITSITTLKSTAENDLKLEEAKPEVQAALAAKPQLESANATLSQKLTEVNMGEMIAAMEMGSASATLNITKSQLKSAKEQLESAQDQLTDAWEQIRDAQEQLNEGKDQLREGQEELEEKKADALDSADMTNILTVDTVKSLLAAQNFSMPGGYVTEEGIDYLVRVGDKPDDVESLANMPLMDLEMDGVDTIFLKDVADVFMTDNSAESYTNINGDPGILLSIQKQTGYSTGDVSKRLNAEFATLMEEDAGLHIIPLMDQGIYIDLVMDSILNNILIGAALAILILILFLRDLRPTFVIACSIPISLVTAQVCMYFSGITLNVISLSGLALGIGMLVDNSIVVIENIYRMRSEGVPMREAAIEGAREVGGAIMASTLTTVCVFAPIVFTEGITRQLFVDMGLTIAYSLLASLVIAMTVVPAMSSKVLVKTEEKKVSSFFTRLLGSYEWLLARALKVKPLVLVGAVLLLCLSTLAALSNGTAFMTDMDSTQMTATVELEKGSSLADTKEVTDEIVRRIMTIEDVQDVGAMTTSGDMSMLSGGGDVNVSSIYITLDENKKHTNEELAKEIGKMTEDLDCELTLDTSSMDMSAMGGSGIQIVIKGRELDTLQEIATDLAGELAKIKGTEEVSDGQEDTTGELRVIINRDKAIEHGLTVAQVFSMLNARLADPSSATTLTTEIKDYDVLVMNGDDIELTRDTVEELVLDVSKKDGTYEHVPLKEIADFERTEGVSSIQRDAQSRMISVTAAIAEGYNVGLVGNDVERMLKDYDVPEGYSVHMSGENETINDAMKQLVLMLVLALAFMYLIMVAQFQSLLSPFIIMFTVPLAFTGGLLALFVGGYEISVIAMIGFVMLSGIIVNNGIVLIDYTNQLRQEGMEKREALLTAGRTRLRPVLMTALTTILALSGMIFARDMGSDMARPMAVVTTGGLVYGTLLTLFVIPCVYDIFMREKKRREAE